MSLRAWWASASVVGAVAFLGTVSCETVESFDKVLTIVPSSTNLTAAGETVVFQAVVNTVDNLGITVGTSTNPVSGPPVLLPLRWGVSDPDLGVIRAGGGLSAIYERNGAAEGVNYIHVRDSGNRYEAVATVRQLPVP